MKQKKYCVDLVAIDTLDNIKLYTYNVYRILFNGLFHISVFSASNADINKAHDECIDFVYSKNGKISTF